MAAGVIRQRRSGWAASVPRPLHGGSTSTRSKGPSARATAASATLDAHAARAQPRAGRAQGLGPARVRSTATISAPSAAQRGQVRRLAARRGAEVEHALAGLRGHHPRHRHRRARLRPHRALPHNAEPRRSNGPSSTSASGSTGSVRLGTPRAAATASRSLTSVLARRRVLGGLVVRGQQGARRLGAELGPPLLSQPQRHRVQERRAGGVAVVQRAQQRVAALARGPAQHGVDEAGGPAARPRLGQVDALGHGGAVGHAVEVEQLVEPEPRRRQHRRVQRATGRSASPASRWSSVALRCTVP